MRVEPRDERYRKLVTWLANEHNVLQKALGREPTVAEHRAHAHVFIDMVCDDEEKLWADLRKAQAAAKVVPLMPPQPS